MGEKVAKVGVKKEKNYLYFVDKDGDISRCKASRAGRTKTKQPVEKVSKVGVKKEADKLYYIDKDGDISSAKRTKGRA